MSDIHFALPTFVSLQFPSPAKHTVQRSCGVVDKYPICNVIPSHSQTNFLEESVVVRSQLCFILCPTIPDLRQHSIVFLFVQNLEPYSNVVYKAYTRTLELDHFRFFKKYSSLNGVPELACPPVQMRSANSLQLLINIVVLPYISKVIFNKYTSQLYITMIEIFLVTVTRYVNININI